MKNNNNGKKIHRETKRTRKRIKENEKKTKKKKNKNNIKGKTIVKVKFFKQKQLLLLCFRSFLLVLRDFAKPCIFLSFCPIAISFFFPSTFTSLKIDFVMSYSRGPSPSRRIGTQTCCIHLLVVEFGRFSIVFFLLLLLSVLLYFVLFVRDRFF